MYVWRAGRHAQMEEDRCLDIKDPIVASILNDVLASPR
jgi:hypothetical protein